MAISFFIERAFFPFTYNLYNPLPGSKKILYSKADLVEPILKEPNAPINRLNRLLLRLDN